MPQGSALGPLLLLSTKANKIIEKLLPNSQKFTPVKKIHWRKQKQGILSSFYIRSASRFCTRATIVSAYNKQLNYREFLLPFLLLGVGVCCFIIKCNSLSSKSISRACSSCSRCRNCSSCIRCCNWALLRSSSLHRSSWYAN